MGILRVEFKYDQNPDNVYNKIVHYLARVGATIPAEPTVIRFKDSRIILAKLEKRTFLRFFSYTARIPLVRVDHILMGPFEIVVDDPDLLQTAKQESYTLTNVDGDPCRVCCWPPYKETDKVPNVPKKLPYLVH